MTDERRSSIVFFINTTILFLQLLLFRKQFKRLVTDPVKGVFVPLIVLSYVDGLGNRVAGAQLDPLNLPGLQQ